jgi:hypothetical protein
VSGSPISADRWSRVFATVVDGSHLATGGQLSSLVDEAVSPLGLTAEVLVVDLSQRALTPVHPQVREALAVDGTLAGRAYQHSEILPGTGGDGARVLWVPMLDGTERAGVLRIGLGPDVTEDDELRRWLWSLSGLVGHIVISKIAYSDHLRRLRGAGALSEAAELLWQLLPPRTCATGGVVVTALLEPRDDVAGDAYDYAVDDHTVELAVLDGLGHDLPATQATALALTAIRHARRHSAVDVDLAAIAAQADRLITAQTRPGETSFVTAALARLDIHTGLLSYLLAGHPPPLLFRAGRLVKELAHPPRLPLGVTSRDPRPYAVAAEQLEPGDRVLFYSDGVTEARDADGLFFGEQRLVDFAERAALDQVSAPETLRRLAVTVLEHQGGKLQDDATLLMLDWSITGSRMIFPTLA